MMQNYLNLEEQMASIARTGIKIDSEIDGFTISIWSQGIPNYCLWSCKATWKSSPNDDVGRQVFLGFNHFNDAIPVYLEGLDKSNLTPIIIGQEIFNHGILNNPYSWMEVIDFKMEILECDAEKWNNV